MFLRYKINRILVIMLGGNWVVIVYLKVLGKWKFKFFNLLKGEIGI